MITETQIDAAMFSIPPGEYVARDVMRRALEAAQARCERNHLESMATITLSVAKWMVLAGWITGSGGTELPAFAEQLLEAIGVAIDVAIEAEP